MIELTILHVTKFWYLNRNKRQAQWL